MTRAILAKRNNDAFGIFSSLNKSEGCNQRDYEACAVRSTLNGEKTAVIKIQRHNPQTSGPCN